MKKCIIYLGGSATQSVNFEYFKNNKIYTILVDQNPKCFCRKYSNIFINISQTDILNIIIKLKKIISSKNLKIIDCFGVAHYSYPAVNKIKKTFIKNYKTDNFLLYKHVQKQKLLNYKITPKYLKLPTKITFSKNRNNYMNKIYSFVKNNNFKAFIKPSTTHQGVGISEIKMINDKNLFIKKYYLIILNSYKYCNHLYIEQKVEGRLLNLDIIKNENDEVIFLPTIFRDKVIFNDKRKYLSVFQYINNENIISKKHLNKIKQIFIDIFPKKKIFSTIDCIILGDELNVLELSPHFHNSKIIKFLNNQFVLDFYFKEKFSNKILKIKKKTNIGGYIFLLNNNQKTKKLLNIVKTNSSKILVDDIDISKRKKFFKKHAFVKKKFSIIYFKCKNDFKLKIISEYLEDNKNEIY